MKICLFQIMGIYVIGFGHCRFPGAAGLMIINWALGCTLSSSKVKLDFLHAVLFFRTIGSDSGTQMSGH